MGKCNNCSKSVSTCTCKKKPETCCTSCTEKVSTNCVIYDGYPNRSNLSCFLGVNNGATLTKILEILDKKLCIPVCSCAKEKLGLGYETDVSMAVVKILDYICEQEDVKIKVSEEDTSNGYLFEKIEVGDCIKKSIITNYLGVQKVKIELDFPCIEDKLSCCGESDVSISIQGSNTICGNNSTLLTATSNCSTPIVWSNGLTGPTIQATAGVYYATCGGKQSNIITVTSTGNCDCEPIWRDIVPVIIFCGIELNRDLCKKYILQSNQCNNITQWVEYTGSDWDGSGCPGCVTPTVPPIAPPIAPPIIPSPVEPPINPPTEPPIAPSPVTPSPIAPSPITPIAPSPITPTSCIEPTSITVNGNLEPFINSEEVYTSTKIGGSSNNTYSWTVQGGVIQGSSTGESVNVLWGNNTTELSSVNLSVGCLGGSTPKFSFNFFTLKSNAPSPATPVAPTPARTDYWNLKYCFNDGDAVYQVDDSTLTANIVLRDNSSGLCYYTVNQGALVGPLLTNYYETGDNCQDCMSLPPIAPSPVNPPT